MAYGEKYRYYFYWDHDSTSNYYKVSFLEDGYSSTVTDLTAGTNPFTINVKGQKDSISQPILGTEASFNIIVGRSDVDDIDADMMASNYKDMIVKLIQDPDGTPLTKWVGFLLPANSTREYQGYKFTYNLSAVDGLADLKEYVYSSNGQDSGVPYNGFTDILTVIKTAIEKVADFLDLQLNFRIQLGTYSDQMTSTQNAFKENEIAQELFYTVNNEGQRTYDNCYTVLEKILKPFYCRMMQSDGYYWIWCGYELQSYYFEYNWELAQQSRTQIVRSITLFGVPLFTKEIYGRGTLSKVAGAKEINLELYNRPYEVELITNGGFANNITGWTNGDAAASASTWTTFSWYNYPGWGGTLGAAYSGAGAAASYYYHTTSTFTLTVGANAPSVTATVKCEWNSSAGGGSQFPNLRMRIWNSTNGYLAGTNGYIGFFGLGGFQDFGEVFDPSSLTVGANYLEIEVQITDATDTATQFYFDNVTLTQTPTNEPSDFRYRAQPTTGTNKEIKSDTVYIADQIESTADLCSIKDSGGNFTTTWDRYGQTDTLPLMEVLLQQIINDNRKFMDYVNCTARLGDVDLHLAVYDSSLGLTARYFDIIGASKNYREGTIELQMKQNNLSESDVSINKFTNRLGTQYGETIE